MKSALGAVPGIHAVPSTGAASASVPTMEGPLPPRAARRARTRRGRRRHRDRRPPAPRRRPPALRGPPVRRGRQWSTGAEPLVLVGGARWAPPPRDRPRVRLRRRPCPRRRQGLVEPGGLGPPPNPTAWCQDGGDERPRVQRVGGDDRGCRVAPTARAASAGSPSLMFASFRSRRRSVQTDPGPGCPGSVKRPRVGQEGAEVPSCSASMRAFHSRLEACQPSSLWPSRQ